MKKKLIISKKFITINALLHFIKFNLRQPSHQFKYFLIIAIISLLITE